MMGMAYHGGRARLQGLILYIKTVSLLILGPIGAFGHLGPSVVGGLFGCPYSIPFILCPICPAPCTFSLIRPWLFGGIVATSLLMGRVFCGVVCPFGVVSGLLFRAPVRKLPVSGVDSRLVYLKYGGVVLSLYLMLEAAAMMLGVWPVGGLWSFLILHRGEMVIAVMAAVLILLVSSTIVYKPWCRYLCPIGTLLSASNRFSLLSMERDPDECGDCDDCLRGCPFGLHDYSDATECIRCLSCYTACRMGVLQLKLRHSQRDGTRH